MSFYSKSWNEKKYNIFLVKQKRLRFNRIYFATLTGYFCATSITRIESIVSLHTLEFLRKPKHNQILFTNDLKTFVSYKALKNIIYVKII